MRPAVTFIHTNVEYNIDANGELFYRLTGLNFLGQPYNFTQGQNISKIREMVNNSTDMYIVESYKHFLYTYDKACLAIQNRHAVDVF